jgi:NAD(P)-dependent dehydrogenase (short-subunit alcohol dehydrogenase family)
MKPPVVLITGALTGIGRATALAFAQEGARTVVSGRRDEEGHKLVAELRNLGAEAEFLRSDVRHEDEVRRLVGTLLSMKHELRVMLAQGSGSIINVSSTFGQTGGAGASVYAASKHAVEGLTQSAALEAAGSGVRVNVVAPGPIDTGMLTRFTETDERKAGLIAGVPLKRVGKPEEIAQTIVYLSSDKASFITGATIAVDGGKTAL